MFVSVVTTLYRSAPYVREFYEEARKAISPVASEYEIIFVNDGSPDHSAQLVRELIAEDPGVMLVDLSRNFGHHKAVMTGLLYSKGDLVFLVDSDLEEHPTLFTAFYEKLRSDATLDVVYGETFQRTGSAFRKWSGGVFWNLLNYFSDIEIPKNVLMARLMSRRYVEALKSYSSEQHLFLGGIFPLAGFKQAPIKVEKPFKGTSTYSLSKRIGQAADAILSFSNKPLIYVSYLGLIITLFSLSLSVFLFARRLFNPNMALGWSSLMVSLWFIGGILLSGIGLIGLYLGRVYTQVKERPFTVVREVVNQATLKG